MKVCLWAHEWLPAEDVRHHLHGRDSVHVVAEGEGEEGAESQQGHDPEAVVAYRSVDGDELLVVFYEG